MDDLYDETDGSKQHSKMKPFTKYCQVNRPKFRQKYPKCTAAQIATLLSQEWAKLSPEKQNLYILPTSLNEPEPSNQRISKFKVAKMISPSSSSGFPASHPLANINLPSSVTGIPPSPNINQSKGKMKKKNNSAYSGKIDADNDIYQIARGTIPAPILLDSTTFSNENEQNLEASARRLMNFTDHCRIINTPISSFDISWACNHPF